MRLAALLLLGAGLMFARPQQALVQDGNFWVEVVSAGSIPVKAAQSLKVVTQGSIVVRGARSNELQYAIRKRVRANSPQQAEKLLKLCNVEVKSTSTRLQINIVNSRVAQVSADLEIHPPMAMPETSLETSLGNIEAYDLAGNVDAVSGGGLVQMDRIGSAVKAHTGGGPIILGEVRGNLQASSGGGAILVQRAGGDAIFETAGGDISAGFIGGKVTAITAGGSIQVVRALSSVNARTAGGRINVLYAGGPVLAENNSGLIDVAGAQGVRCQAQVGAVRVRNVTGALQVQTGAGNIMADLTGKTLSQDSFLATSRGDITVLIPSNFAVTVRAQNQFGGITRIVSDFPEIRMLGIDSRPLFAEGELNGGGPVLQITAIGGTIYLKRQN